MIRQMMFWALLAAGMTAQAQSPAPAAAPKARPAVNATSEAEIRARIDAERSRRKVESETTATSETAIRARIDAERSRREMEQAKAELERASARLAEISQKLARSEIEAALARPAFERPILGVVMAPSGAEGVRLAAVTPESPAAKAGLRSGDVVLSIDGVVLDGAQPEDRLQQARDLLADLKEDQQLRLAYRRGSQQNEVKLKATSMPGLVWWRGGEGDLASFPRPDEAMLADLARVRGGSWDIGTIAPLAGCGEDGEECVFGPMAEAWRWRGLRLAAIEPKLGRYFGTETGVLVLNTPRDELQGLEPGDVLLSIDGTRVTEPQEAMRLMRGKSPGDRIAIEYLRDRSRKRADVEAPKQVRFAFPPMPPAPPAAPAAPSAPGAVVAPPAPPSPAAVAAPPAPPSPMAPPPPPPDDGDRGVLKLILH